MPSVASWAESRLTAGARCSLPVLALLALGFLAPLVTVLGYSFATPRSFAVFRSLTLETYRAIFDPGNTVWVSFAWSLALAAVTVLVLAVVAYPIAWGLARTFGRRAGLVSLLFVFPLFISENVRLFGWVLFFIKGGVLEMYQTWCVSRARVKGWRRARPSARRARQAELPQALDLGRIRHHQPDQRPATGLRPAAAEQATPQPTVDRRARHLQAKSQLFQRQLVVPVPLDSR